MGNPPEIMGKHGWEDMKNVWKAYENAAETMGECSMNDLQTCRFSATRSRHPGFHHLQNVNAGLHRQTSSGHFMEECCGNHGVQLRKSDGFRCFSWTAPQ